MPKTKIKVLRELICSIGKLRPSSSFALWLQKEEKFQEASKGVKVEQSQDRIQTADDVVPHSFAVIHGRG